MNWNTNVHGVSVSPSPPFSFFAAAAARCRRSQLGSRLGGVVMRPVFEREDVHLDALHHGRLGDAFASIDEIPGTAHAKPVENVALGRPVVRGGVGGDGMGNRASRAIEEGSAGRRGG